MTPYDIRDAGVYLYYYVPGGGYVALLPRSQGAAEVVLNHLKSNKWLDISSTALEIELTVDDPAIQVRWSRESFKS